MQIPSIKGEGLRPLLLTVALLSTHTALTCWWGVSCCRYDDPRGHHHGHPHQGRREKTLHPFCSSQLLLVWQDFPKGKERLASWDFLPSLIPEVLWTESDEINTWWNSLPHSWEKCFGCALCKSRRCHLCEPQKVCSAVVLALVELSPLWPYS